MSTTRHKAVILLNIEVHPVDERTQECTAKTVSPDKLKEYNIKSKQIVCIEGFDEHDCLLKVKNWLESTK